MVWYVTLRASFATFRRTIGDLVRLAFEAVPAAPFVFASFLHSFVVTSGANRGTDGIHSGSVAELEGNVRIPSETSVVPVADVDVVVHPIV